MGATKIRISALFALCAAGCVSNAQTEQIVMPVNEDADSVASGRVFVNDFPNFYSRIPTQQFNDVVHIKRIRRSDDVIVGHCSGAILYPGNIIVTARHCLGVDDMERKDSSAFRYTFRTLEGDMFYSSSRMMPFFPLEGVDVAIKKKQEGDKYSTYEHLLADIAFFHLDQNYYKKRGYFIANTDHNQRQSFIAGIGADRDNENIMLNSENCFSVRNEVFNRLYNTSCQIEPGDSGGPEFGYIKASNALELEGIMVSRVPQGTQIESISVSALLLWSIQKFAHIAYDSFSTNERSESKRGTILDITEFYDLCVENLSEYDCRAWPQSPYYRLEEVEALEPKPAPTPKGTAVTAYSSVPPKLPYDLYRDEGMFGTNGFAPTPPY